MLKRCIAAENRKLHRSPIWLLFFVMPLISASYGTFNYLQNLEILHERWYSLWTQHTLFTRCCSSLPWWRPMRPTCGGWSIWVTTGI